MLPAGAAISVDASGVGDSRRTNPALSCLSAGGFAVAWSDNALAHETVRYGRIGVEAGAP